MDCCGDERGSFVRQPYVVALTGASGVIYGLRLVKALAEMSYKIALVISDAARLVLREERNVSLRNLVGRDCLEELFGSEVPLRSIQLYSVHDFMAPIASGSFPTKGMIVMPCSMGTLGAIAGGLSQNLIHRAADCVLKEGRKLVLVPRETPLNAIHLENMLKLTKLGVSMVPAMPAFYSGARCVEELVDFVVGKVLDQLGIMHTLYPRWTGGVKSVESIIES